MLLKQGDGSQRGAAAAGSPAAAAGSSSATSSGSSKNKARAVAVDSVSVATNSEDVDRTKGSYFRSLASVSGSSFFLVQVAQLVSTYLGERQTHKEVTASMLTKAIHPVVFKQRHHPAIDLEKAQSAADGQWTLYRPGQYPMPLIYSGNCVKDVTDEDEDAIDEGGATVANSKRKRGGTGAKAKGGQSLPSSTCRSRRSTKKRGGPSAKSKSNVQTYLDSVTKRAGRASASTRGFLPAGRAASVKRRDGGVDTRSDGSKGAKSHLGRAATAALDGFRAKATDEVRTNWYEKSVEKIVIEDMKRSDFCSVSLQPLVKAFLDDDPLDDVDVDLSLAASTRSDKDGRLLGSLFRRSMCNLWLDIRLGEVEGGSSPAFDYSQLGSAMKNVGSTRSKAIPSMDPPVLLNICCSRCGCVIKPDIVGAPEGEEDLRKSMGVDGWHHYRVCPRIPAAEKLLVQMAVSLAGGSSLVAVLGSEVSPTLGGATAAAAAGGDGGGDDGILRRGRRKRMNGSKESSNKKARSSYQASPSSAPSPEEATPPSAPSPEEAFGSAFDDAADLARQLASCVRVAVKKSIKEAVCAAGKELQETTTRSSELDRMLQTPRGPPPTKKAKTKVERTAELSQWLESASFGRDDTDLADSKDAALKGMWIKMFRVRLSDLPPVRKREFQSTFRSYRNRRGATDTERRDAQYALGLLEGKDYKYGNWEDFEPINEFLFGMVNDKKDDKKNSIFVAMEEFFGEDCLGDADLFGDLNEQPFNEWITFDESVTKALQLDPKTIESMKKQMVAKVCPMGPAYLVKVHASDGTFETHTVESLKKMKTASSGDSSASKRNWEKFLKDLESKGNVGKAIPVPHGTVLRFPSPPGDEESDSQSDAGTSTEATVADVRHVEPMGRCSRTIELQNGFGACEYARVQELGQKVDFKSKGGEGRTFLASVVTQSPGLTKMYQRGKAIQVPKGARSGSTAGLPPTELTRFDGPPTFLRYAPKDRQCVPGSVVNAMYHAGDEDGAVALAAESLTYEDVAKKIDETPDGRPAQSHLDCLMRYLMTHMGYQYKSLPDFDPSVATPDVKVVALRDSDGDEGHVVAIVGDVVVDGNRGRVMPLTHDALAWCCGRDDASDDLRCVAAHGFAIWPSPKRLRAISQKNPFHLFRGKPPHGERRPLNS